MTTLSSIVKESEEETFNIAHKMELIYMKIEVEYWLSLSNEEALSTSISELKSKVMKVVLLKAALPTQL